MSVPSDLGKLTVPQLKTLCKERRITGYSKLSKAGLLQKLAVPLPLVVPFEYHQGKAPSIPTEPPPSTRETSTKRPARIDTSAPSKRIRTSPKPATITNLREELLIDASMFKTPDLPVPFHGGACNESTVTKTPLPTQRPELSQNRIVANTREPTTKGSAHIDTPTWIRTSLKPTTNASHEPLVSTSTPQEKSLVDSSAFKVPQLHVQPQRSFHTSTLVGQPPRINQSVASRHIAGGGRFKPPVPSTPKLVEAPQTSTVSLTPREGDSAPDFNFHATPLPVLSYISFPPKASERKWVYKWAIILSALSPADRQTCMLVSRTFRYAVYLSATHILWKNYAGRRLDTLLEQHPKNMTNLWPYLRFRMSEVSKRRHTFKQLFLGQYTNSIGYNPLSARLWTSPDDEKQVDIALRFVLTRMWFAVSIGAYGHDASAWSKSIVQDAREVVKGEIWQVITRHQDTGEICSFYVLEATCEVIGHSPSAQLQGENTLGYRLRADWTAWISQRSQALPGTGPCSLLERVRWSNTEDYYCGISKVWLRRVQQGRDADSFAKRSIAERYILANVVANGISGKWMSTIEMAQEFTGLPAVKSVYGSRTVGRSMDMVNMYLAAHHHIESVHFTTSNGEALHNAVAVVQTPGRGYYVLRDNGMQVGCEEEGIPEVWQRIICCGMLGRACLLAPS